MHRRCDSCGRYYVAKRPSSRFCGDTCRKRYQRDPSSAPPPPPEGTEPQPVDSELVTETRRNLESAGRLNTVIGQQAVLIAQRLASPHETGASIASLSREFRVVMESALSDVAATDPLDELRDRRDRKRAASG